MTQAVEALNLGKIEHQVLDAMEENLFVLGTIPHTNQRVLYQLEAGTDKPLQVVKLPRDSQEVAAMAATAGTVVLLGADSTCQVLRPGAEKFETLSLKSRDPIFPEQVFAGANGFYVTEINKVFYFEANGQGVDTPAEALRLNPPDVLRSVKVGSDGRDVFEVVLADGQVTHLPPH